jgi:uncharacterized coiled-coil protein SlyX
MVHTDQVQGTAMSEPHDPPSGLHGDNEHAYEFRLERMETALAHLQHDMDGVHASLLSQLRRLQEFETRFTRLEQEFALQNEPAPRPDAASEKPPHY